MISTVLFDLDGTLLPMDQEVFVGAYMQGLTAAAAPLGYDARTLAHAIRSGTEAMIRNDGERTNEAVFWDTAVRLCGEGIAAGRRIFDEFYRTDFPRIGRVCGFSPKSAQTVARIRDMGFRTALATNPLFPAVATAHRMAWAGLRAEDFECVTVYETSHFAKPNLDYYREVCATIGVAPTECLMVGNDVADDMVAERLGMRVFLLTDCLINKENADISRYPQGDLDDLIAYVEGIGRA